MSPLSSIGVFVFAAFILSVTPAFAQDPAQELPTVTETVVVKGEARPAVLLPLYLGHVGLQAADVATTLRALGEPGHKELNPLLGGGNSAIMITVKAASTSTAILLAEKMWKRNRKAAVIMMIAGNAAMSAVAIHNYRHVQR